MKGLQIRSGRYKVIKPERIYYQKKGNSYKKINHFTKFDIIQFIAVGIAAMYCVGCVIVHCFE